jgi:hypothetical protein
MMAAMSPNPIVVVVAGLGVLFGIALVLPSLV